MSPVFTRGRIAMLVGVALVALYVVYQQFGTATLALTSEPAGATVRVDGRVVGVTPLSRIDLDSGAHRIEVQHSHFAVFSEGVSLARGDHLSRHVVLQPGQGTFEFLSNPRGAWVELDGTRLEGRTPFNHTAASGEYTVRMGLEERRAVEETVVLNAGAAETVNFNLNIDPHGSLTISLRPRDARVTFIDSDIEYSPKMRVQIGEYALRVSRPGYVSQEFRYEVRYGDNLHQVSLKRAFGELRVRVTPAADVTVIYDDGGRTHRKAYEGPMRVPTGRVEVRARALGHRTAFKRIDLAPGGAQVNLQLEQMQVEPGSQITDALKAGGSAPVMIVLPAGEFRMGSASGPPSEQPQRTVTLTQPFAMSQHEVTVRDYLRFAEVTGYTLHPRLDTSALEHPITRIGFRDAMAYADWLTEQTGHKYRLPSEAEWEYAARGGTQGDYFFGDDVLQLCQFANLADKSARKVFREWDTVACDDGAVRPAKVGSWQPNPFGLHDMLGNVSEWVAECGMPDYATAPTDGSPAEAGLDCGSHGVRGGSWDSTAEELRVAYRNTARNANDDRGLRLVREL